MYRVEDINKAKQYLSEQGYGTGSNFTLNAVANLMAEWLAKNCTIPIVTNYTDDYVNWLEDIVLKQANDVETEVKKLNIPSVVGRSEQYFCGTCNELTIKQQGRRYCEKCRKYL